MNANPFIGKIFYFPKPFASFISFVWYWKIILSYLSNGIGRKIQNKRKKHFKDI